MSLSVRLKHELFSTSYPKHINVINWVGDCYCLAMDDNL